MALPFIRIYIGDVKKDTDLLTPSAFGGYMRLLMFAMHESPTRGEVNFTLPQLCRVFGAANNEEALQILNEIVDPQFNIVDYETNNSKHFIRNRRMVRETKVSKIRSDAGKEGAKVTNSKFKVAEDLPQQNDRQNEKFAEHLPEGNSAAKSSISQKEGVFSENAEEFAQNGGFAAANGSTKNRQNCNTNNSNNSINSNKEEEGVKGEEETKPGATVDRGTAVLIIPELRNIFLKHRKTYQFDPAKDMAPLRLIVQAISNGEGVSIHSLEGIEQIKQSFEAIVVYTLTNSIYKNFQLSQIEKYFQTICENFRNNTAQPVKEFPKHSVVENNISTAQGATDLIKNKYANQGGNA